ncbi:MAG: hypothetical protein U1C49_01305 [Candidatus Andersenbacteria bacterium]|nr:hypothetical protein [bacterium]MDZ4225463.1 hypothetical protein [Candidatus Andersenbacteria bacterium]
MREINLLPPERRALLRRESLMVSVETFFNSLVMAVTLLTMVAIMLIVVLLVMGVAAKGTTKTELEAAVKEYQALREQISKQNLVLEKVSNIGNRRAVWSDFLRKLLPVVPPGVTLSDITATTIIENDEIFTPSLTVGGQAESRSTLTVLEGRIKALESVASVNSPTTNLLERSNPVFQFNINLKPR